MIGGDGVGVGWEWGWWWVGVVAQNFWLACSLVWEFRSFRNCLWGRTLIWVRVRQIHRDCTFFLRCLRWALAVELRLALNSGSSHPSFLTEDYRPHPAYFPRFTDYFLDTQWHLQAGVGEQSENTVEITNPLVSLSRSRVFWVLSDFLLRIPTSHQNITEARETQSLNGSLPRSTVNCLWDFLSYW